MANDDKRVVETPVEARAGFLDRPVLAVLAVSLVLAVIVLMLVYGGFFASPKP
jgi:hypothetical protein